MIARLITWWKARIERGIGPNGGYWGGVIMVLRRAGARAAAFLRAGKADG